MSVLYLYSIVEETNEPLDPVVGWGVRSLTDNHAKSVIHDLYKRFYLVTKDNFVFEFRDMASGTLKRYKTKFPINKLTMFPEFP